MNSNVECSLKKRTWQLYASISDFDHPVTNRSQLGRKKKILYFHYLFCSCVISASPNLPCWFCRENIRWLFFLLYTPLRSGKNYLPYASDCISENGDQQMASTIFFIWCWITNLRGKIKYLSMNIPLDVLCSLGSLISHYMFTFKLFLTSLAKNLEAFSCASSIIWIFQRLGRRGLTWINLVLEKSFAQSIRHPLNTGCVSRWKLLIFIALWPYMLFTIFEMKNFDVFRGGQNNYCVLRNSLIYFKT